MKYILIKMNIIYCLKIWKMLEYYEKKLLFLYIIKFQLFYKISEYLFDWLKY